MAPSKGTTGAFLRENWPPGLRAQVRPGTWAEHKSKVEVHLVLAIGGVPLQRLTPGHLSAVYAGLLERGLSARTVLHVHATIRRALADATRWAWSPATSPCSPPHPARAGRSYGSGQRPSYGRSSPLSSVIACMASGSWPPRLGCAAGSCSASSEPTSTSVGPGLRSAGPWLRSATK